MSGGGTTPGVVSHSAHTIDSGRTCNSTSEIEIVHQDAHYLVVNKPHDVLTQPTKEGDISVESLARSATGIEKLWFPHQLDYATSGVICLALSRKAAGTLGKLFQARSIHKEYRALVHGEVPEGRLTVDAEVAPWAGPVEIVPRGREGQNIDFRQSIGTPENPGKPSLTYCEAVRVGTMKGHTVTEVALFPQSGRRHQLRIHMLHAGLPIVGDATYCQVKEVCERMCLHAFQMKVPFSGVKGLLNGPDLIWGTSEPFSTLLDDPRPPRPFSQDELSRFESGLGNGCSFDGTCTAKLSLSVTT